MRRIIIKEEEIIKDELVPLDLNKIERHEVMPVGLELELTRWHSGNLTVDLSLMYGSIGNTKWACTLKNCPNKEEAEREYQDLLTKFKEGKYKLHLYSNGKVKVEFDSK